MPVIVIREATDLEGLTDRVLRSNASTPTREAAARALREANPGVDLQALRAGAVVVVPELHAGLRSPEGSVSEGAADATGRVATQLSGLAEAFADGASRRAEARERAVEALDTTVVKRATRGDEAAKAVVKQLRDRLADEEEREEEEQELLGAVMVAWGEDLEALREAWPAVPR